MVTPKTGRPVGRPRTREAQPKRGKEGRPCLSNTFFENSDRYVLALAMALDKSWCLRDRDQGCISGLECTLLRLIRDGVDYDLSGTALHGIAWLLAEKGMLGYRPNAHG